MDTGPVFFATTTWTNVFLAQGDGRDIARRCLGHLIERYWRPVYGFIRQKGRSSQDAADLTQQFFTEFIEKDIVSYAERDRGKFRTFLLACVRRFLALQHRTASRRSSTLAIPALETAENSQMFGPAVTETPERAFERNWAKALIENCVARLQEECRVLGKEMQFRVFQARFLRRRMEEPDYRSIAAEVGVSVTDVDNLLRRAKRRFRRILRREVHETTMVLGDTEDEINSLLRCLSHE